MFVNNSHKKRGVKLTDLSIRDNTAHSLRFVYNA